MSCSFVLFIGEGNDEFDYQSDEMKEIAFIVGEDPEELRERVK